MGELVQCIITKYSPETNKQAALNLWFSAKILNIYIKIMVGFKSFDDNIKHVALSHVTNYDYK